jgi:hypothetical protein
MDFGYTCNGSPRGCEGKRFGGCQWHYDKETASRREAIIKAARDFVSNCYDDSEAGKIISGLLEIYKEMENEN